MLEEYKNQAIIHFGFEDVHTIAIFRVDEMAQKGMITPLDAEIMAEHIFDRGMNATYEGIELRAQTL